MAGIKVIYNYYSCLTSAFLFFMYFSTLLWIRFGSGLVSFGRIWGVKVVKPGRAWVPDYNATTLITSLVSLAFAGSIGMTFVILACALPEYKLWWPFFVVLFYILSPIPTMIARRHTDSTSGNSACMETAIFITMGFLVSSFALPIVLARAAVIAWGACYLTLAGNVIVYLTILGFFTIFDMDDSDYTMW